MHDHIYIVPNMESGLQEQASCQAATDLVEVIRIGEWQLPYAAHDAGRLEHVAKLVAGIDNFLKGDVVEKSSRAPTSEFSLDEIVQVVVDVCAVVRCLLFKDLLSHPIILVKNIQESDVARQWVGPLRVYLVCGELERNGA